LLLTKAGFRLTKWLPNNEDVCAWLVASVRGSELSNLLLVHTFDLSFQERDLGVAWNVQ